MNENELRLKQYQTAIDANTVVLRADIHGVVTFVNDEFCKITHYLPDEILGQKYTCIKHPSTPNSVYDKIAKFMLKRCTYKAIMKHLAKNGETFYLNEIIMPILNEAGQIDEIVAIGHDVTESFVLYEKLIKAQNELKELNLSLENKIEAQTRKLVNLNRDLEARVREETKKNEEKTHIMFQQSRLASIGEMIGNIAHQWRQPLSELGIDLYKMKQNVANEIKFVEAYEHAKLVIKSMSNTIDDFRTFFNPNKEKEIFLISESVRDATMMLNGSLKKDEVKINIDIKKDAKIRGFKSELTQVFTNFIANALDALNSSQIRHKFIQITILSAKNEVIVVVYNNGAKIPTDIIYKIFEPYFTTKYKSHGTGLGLYMSKLIVERMNGKINVKNRNTGVEFDVRIPIFEDGK